MPCAIAGQALLKAAHPQGFADPVIAGFREEGFARLPVHVVVHEGDARGTVAQTRIEDSVGRKLAPPGGAAQHLQRLRAPAVVAQRTPRLPQRGGHAQVAVAPAQTAEIDRMLGIILQRLTGKEVPVALRVDLLRQNVLACTRHDAVAPSARLSTETMLDMPCDRQML